jgi:hypothetical protein
MVNCASGQPFTRVAHTHKKKKKSNLELMKAQIEGSHLVAIDGLTTPMVEAVLDI